jgi:Acetyltransferases, including N-acetylases of ribosomal proteins
MRLPMYSRNAIDTRRLRLRVLDIEDVHMLRSAISMSIDHLREWLPWADSVPSLNDVAAFIHGSVKRGWSGRYFYFGIFRGDVLVGCCQLDGYEGGSDYEVGYWGMAKYSRLGFVSEAVDQLCDFAFEWCDASHLFIKTDPANRSAIKVALRSGFSPRQEIGLYEGSRRLVVLDRWACAPVDNLS